MSKIDCNITENYFKEKARMTKRKGSILGCTISCYECPLSSKNNPKHINCQQFEDKYITEAIAIVQKWSDEHPVKTIKDAFLEKYPNAQLQKDETPLPCARTLGYQIGKCTAHCDECWNIPLSKV